MRPAWFTPDGVPFNQMWDDAKYWLPQILSGCNLEGSFVYDENL